MISRNENDTELVQTTLKLGRPRVGITGDKGSHSYLAALDFFNDESLDQKGCQPATKDSNDETMRGVQQGKLDYALVSIGSEHQNQLAKLEWIRNQIEKDGDHENNLQIVGFVNSEIDAKYCLYCNEDLAEVKTIYAEAKNVERAYEWLQLIFGNDLKGLSFRLMPNSEAAAAAVVEESQNAVALIPEIPATLHGLVPFQIGSGGEDSKANESLSQFLERYYVVGRSNQTPKTNNRTVIMLRVKDLKGTLAKALRHAQSINLRKIISSVSEDDTDVQQFYMVLACHPNSTEFRHLIEQWKQMQIQVVVLGSFRSKEIQRYEEHPSTRSDSHYCPVGRLPEAPKEIGKHCEQLTIGIIGNKGDYGRQLVDLFSDEQFKFKGKKYRVIGSDRDSFGLTNEQVVNESQVVIFALPMTEAPKVMRQVSRFASEKQLWIDLSSIKSRVVEAMLESPAELIGLHPLVDPTVPWKHQSVIVSPIRCNHWLGWLTDVLDYHKATVHFMDHNRQDKMMGILRTLPQLLSAIAISVLEKQNVDLDEVLKFSSPSFSAMWDSATRFLNEKPEFFQNMQTENFENAWKIAETLAEEAETLCNDVVKPSGELTSRFRRLRSFVGPTRILTNNRQFNHRIRFQSDLSDKTSVTLSNKTKFPGQFADVANMFASYQVDLVAHSSTELHGKYFCKVGLDRSSSEVSVQNAIEWLRKLGWELEYSVNFEG